MLLFNLAASSGGPSLNCIKYWSEITTALVSAYTVSVIVCRQCGSDRFFSGHSWLQSLLMCVDGPSAYISRTFTTRLHAVITALTVYYSLCELLVLHVCNRFLHNSLQGLLPPLTHVVCCKLQSWQRQITMCMAFIPVKWWCLLVITLIQPCGLLGSGHSYFHHLKVHRQMLFLVQT